MLLADKEKLERYDRLLSGKRNNMDAPFVMNSRASRLFAIAGYRSEELEIAIDCDIAEECVENLQRTGKLIECGYEGEKWPSEEYGNAIYELARTELGWTEERMNRVLKSYE